MAKVPAMTVLAEKNLRLPKAMQPRKKNMPAQGRAIKG